MGVWMDGRFQLSFCAMVFGGGESDSRKVLHPFWHYFFLKGTGGAELIVEDALFFVELEHICMGRLDIHSHPPGGVVIKLGTGWQLFF